MDLPVILTWIYRSNFRGFTGQGWWDRATCLSWPFHWLAWTTISHSNQKLLRTIVNNNTKVKNVVGEDLITKIIEITNDGINPVYLTDRQFHNIARFIRDSYSTGKKYAITTKMTAEAMLCNNLAAVFFIWMVMNIDPSNFFSFGLTHTIIIIISIIISFLIIAIFIAEFFYKNQFKQEQDISSRKKNNINFCIFKFILIISNIVFLALVAQNEYISIQLCLLFGFTLAGFLRYQRLIFRLISYSEMP